MKRHKAPSATSKKSRKGPKSVISETASDVQSVREDCQTLGIDIDEEVLERMQRLGIQRTWETTSRLATSLKSRNPITLTSAVDHRNFNEPLMITESLLKEWTYELAQPDPKVIAQALRSIYDKENYCFPTSLRLEVQRLLQILKVQYGRSPEKFVKSMLMQKGSKDNTNKVAHCNYFFYTLTPTEHYSSGPARAQLFCG